MSPFTNVGIIQNVPTSHRITLGRGKSVINGGDDV